MLSDYDADAAATLRLWAREVEPDHILHELGLKRSEVRVDQPEGAEPLILWRPVDYHDTIGEVLDPIVDHLDRHRPSIGRLVVDGVEPQVFLGIVCRQDFQVDGIVLSPRHWDSLARSSTGILFDLYPEAGPVEIEGDGRKWVAVKVACDSGVDLDDFVELDSESIYDHVPAALARALEGPSLLSGQCVQIAFASSNGQGGFYLDVDTIAKIAEAGVSGLVSLHAPPVKLMEG